MTVDISDKPLEDNLPLLLEHVPAVVCRFGPWQGGWRAWFMTRNIDMYGYTVEEFTSGKRTWIDLIHPEDRALVTKTFSDYQAKNITRFKLFYRLLKSNGESIAVTEYNTALSKPDGSLLCYDTVIVSDLQDELRRRLLDEHYNQHVVLNDILLRLQSSDIGHSIQIILDQTGAYLDVSRALLFQNSPDHTKCSVVYEWCNQGIESIRKKGYNCVYEDAIPEVYSSLRETGSLTFDYGKVPERCRQEFEAQGVISSAIYAVYQGGEPYGFVCFDDCVLERVWDQDTIRFLKHISNLLSGVMARHHTATLLEQNQKSYQAVLNNVDSYVFVIDPDNSTILFANRAFKEAFEEDYAGKSIENYLPLRTMEGEPIFSRSGTRRKKQSAYPEVYCEASGEWLAVSSEIITWVDGRTARLVNCYDITEKKLATDALRAASKAKTEFLARTSHEIRTPMNAILGLAELILREEATDNVHSHAASIKQAGRTLLAIVNDILDFSKIESGKMEIVSSSYHLSSLIHDVISIVRMRLLGSRLCFMVNVDSTLPEEVRGDEVRIRQVMLNVLGNAAKFTRHGYIYLEVKGGPRDDSGAFDLEFVVSDTGKGIKPGDLDKLFKDYVQLERHAQRGIESTGLGLNISKKLCRAMGGDISVESVYGSGTTFRIVIPQLSHSTAVLAEVRERERKRVLIYDARTWYGESVLRSCRNLSLNVSLVKWQGGFEAVLNDGPPVTHVLVAPAQYEIAQQTLKQQGKDAHLVMLADLEKPDVRHVRTLPMPVQAMSLANVLNDVREAGTTGVFTNAFIAPSARVLIVDDNATNLVVAAGLMRVYQMHIDTCLSGREAMQMLDAASYDLLFIDHMMPGMDGIALAHAIRNKEGGHSRMPLIALTANALSGVREMYLAEGFDDFLSKPIEVGRLDDELRKWLPPDKLVEVGTPEQRKEAVSHICVKGLNVRVGIANSGGMNDLYENVLGTFCLGADRMMEKIHASHDSGDLALLTVHVHALKSSLATIGATELSTQAAQLERAAKEGQVGEVERHLDGFLARLSELLGEIGRVLSGLKQTDSKKETGSMSMLRSSLERLEKQCIVRDVIEAEATLEKLRACAWEDSINHMLDSVAEDMRLFDFDHALVGIVSLRNVLR